MPRRSFSAFFYVAVSLLAIGSYLLWSRIPPIPPRVTGGSQITHDGRVKTNLASDGANLYFTELSDKSSVISRVVATGGDVSKFQVTFPSAQLLDVSPAHSSLLAAENQPSSDHPVWLCPLNGGSAARLGDLTGQEAVWAPDGQHVLLVKGSGLFIADGNGGAPKELVNVPGTPYYPRFSPDGKRVRFSVGDISQNTSAIWEVNSDGSGLHALLPDWHDVSF